jgi:hypothetical protein
VAGISRGLVNLWVVGLSPGKQGVRPPARRLRFALDDLPKHLVDGAGGHRDQRLRGGGEVDGLHVEAAGHEAGADSSTVAPA